MHLLSQLTSNFYEKGAMVNKTAGRMTDGEIACREYVRIASSLYNSKMFIECH